MNTEQHVYWMHYALQLAERAEAQGEIPVGAVIVQDGKLIAEGWNQSISLNDPSAHAEMQAIRQAGKVLNNYRLPETTLYVTLEPCPMCAGLLVHSRIARLVYGAADYKTGAAGSIMNLAAHPLLNHQIDIVAGIEADLCSEKLSTFFRLRRAQKRAIKLNTD